MKTWSTLLAPPTERTADKDNSMDMYIHNYPEQSADYNWNILIWNVISTLYYSIIYFRLIRDVKCLEKGGTILSFVGFNINPCFILIHVIA